MCVCVCVCVCVRACVRACVCASTIAIRPLYDFQANVGGGRLFDMGSSTVNYGTRIVPFKNYEN